MPELPEVETTVSLLKKKVLNKAFVSVWADNKDKSLQCLVGEKIKGIERVGKNIFISLNKDKFLFVHLRMTGHFLWGYWEYVFCNETKKKEWQSKKRIMQDKKNKYLRFVFLFNDNKHLALSDPRKFAKVKLINLEEKKEIESGLGVDPLNISEEVFLSLFSPREKVVKNFLMDQSIIAGIGNIYASEVLFEARVNPQKKLKYLTKKEKQRIYKYIQIILKKAISLRGDSTSDYRLLSGQRGGYQNYHLVYNRREKDCFNCGGKIKRIVVGGRGTYYCPKCQK